MHSILESAQLPNAVFVILHLYMFITKAKKPAKVRNIKHKKTFPSYILLLKENLMCSIYAICLG